MENYKEKYEQALERAKKIHAEKKAQPFDVVTRIFPELKENEDERIRKALIDKIKRLADDECAQYGTDFCAGNYNSDQIIAWLEKQGEQNHVWSEEDEIWEPSDDQLHLSLEICRTEQL